MSAMAKSTRSKSNMERIEEAIAKLASNHLNVSNKLDELIQCISIIEANQHQPSSPSSSSTIPSPVPSTSHLPKMKFDVPRFDRSDPFGWMFKINQFFTYHITPETDRLIIASFVMEGPPIAWFQWMMRSGQITSWHRFLQALEALFASLQYEDPTGILFKLTQSDSVTDYLS